MTCKRQWAFGFLGSLMVMLLPLQTLLPVEIGFLEAVAVVFYAWSVWLLAANQPLGWWVGLVGVVLYAVLFFQVRLFAETAIQVFYFFTSLQAIYIWLRGGESQTERPVGTVSAPWLLISVVSAAVGVWALRTILMAVNGAAPFWDALTTVMSLVAHLYLMGRYVQSWYLWIGVDAIYVPLYASRGLFVTSLLYAVFLLLAIQGLRHFRQELRFQSELSPAVIRQSVS